VSDPTTLAMLARQLERFCSLLERYAADRGPSMPGRWRLDFQSACRDFNEGFRHWWTEDIERTSALLTDCWRSINEMEDRLGEVRAAADLNAWRAAHGWREGSDVQMLDRIRFAEEAALELYAAMQALVGGLQATAAGARTWCGDGELGARFEATREKCAALNLAWPSAPVLSLVGQSN
jgi:hypothetical protein